MRCYYRGFRCICGYLNYRVDDERYGEYYGTK